MPELDLTSRDAAGLPVCFYCRKPLPVVQVRGRKYGLCHGQFSGLLTEDIRLLEDYHARAKRLDT